MATLHLDNVNFVGTAADTKIAAHNGDAAAHLRVATFSDADYVFAAGINVAQQIGTLTPQLSQRMRF